MGELHRLPLRCLPPAPADVSVPETWAALRSAMRITHGTLGEIVDLLDAGAPPAEVFARIDTFNSQITTCGRAVTFLREAGEPPDAA
ncbi:hypothetical protein MKK63_24060 [Methylobacterium sp. J-088]|uniref:hypothetical protein n=1 Tax=Methylobacterium sp. J-088 TaxID=2836664 RepID=UPI001FB96265|nr:hypothetical protein [Methylobacterium sp. J-088]MCJ2065754.1 hypothetical protein [Methylobacterium sp. J-088]